MKRIIHIFAALAALSLCSFGSGKDKYMTFTSVFSVPTNFFLQLDTVNSIYRYCLTISADSDYIIGREISIGKFEFTDTTLIIYSTDMSYPVVYFANVRHLPKNMTKVMFEYSNSGDSVMDDRYLTFYSSDRMDSIETTQTVLRQLESDGKINNLRTAGSRFAVDIPMQIGALKIAYDSIATPVIDLADIPWNNKSSSLYKGVAFHRDGKKGKYNNVWISFHNNPPSRSIYHRVGNDSLAVKGHYGVGMRYHNFIALTREKRKVLTFKDDYYHPYFVRTHEQ